LWNVVLFRVSYDCPCLSGIFMLKLMMMFRVVGTSLFFSRIPSICWEFIIIYLCTISLYVQLGTSQKRTRYARRENGKFSIQIIIFRRAVASSANGRECVCLFSHSEKWFFSQILLVYFCWWWPYLGQLYMNNKKLSILQPEQTAQHRILIWKPRWRLIELNEPDHNQWEETETI
jgi:uncharacterized SAM-binding protein YcdF (DUF218 family)